MAGKFSERQKKPFRIVMVIQIQMNSLTLLQ